MALDTDVYNEVPKLSWQLLWLALVHQSVLLLVGLELERGLLISDKRELEFQ